MLTNRRIQKLHYCRGCLNRRFHKNLQRNDVVVHHMPQRCRSCGEVKNIVYCVRRIMWWKLIF